MKQISLVAVVVLALSSLACAGLMPTQPPAHVETLPPEVKPGAKVDTGIYKGTVVKTHETWVLIRDKDGKETWHRFSALPYFSIEK